MRKLADVKRFESGMPCLSRFGGDSLFRDTGFSCGFYFVCGPSSGQEEKTGFRLNCFSYNYWAVTIGVRSVGGG